MGQLDFEPSSGSAKMTRQLEIEEAQNLQQAMLPDGPLRAPPVQLAYKCRPAAEVGGDFLDYFPMPDGRLGFYLGDVVGKGLPAALYAALAVGILRGIKKSGEEPTVVAELLNRRLLDRQIPRRYCAFEYAVFDPLSSDLRIVNAGLHPRPLCISATDCRELGGGGLPCGIFIDAHYELYTVRLTAGDSVVFSTDGILEAQNPSGEQFGLKRLIQVYSENKNKPAETLLDRVFEAVDKFAAGAPQHDDMTAAVLQLV